MPAQADIQATIEPANENSRRPHEDFGGCIDCADTLGYSAAFTAGAAYFFVNGQKPCVTRSYCTG